MEGIINSQSIKYIITLLVATCFGLVANAEMKLAYINDPDGFTNIRTGQGTQYAIAGTISKEEFFYCEQSGAEWWKVQLNRWKGVPVEGYVHRSRVQFVHELPDKDIRQLFQSVFKLEGELGDTFSAAYQKYDEKRKRWPSISDSLAKERAVQRSESYDELRYTPLLEFFPSYFCRTRDTVLITTFFATCWSNTASANETPDFVAGDCYVCEPELILSS